MARSQSGRIVIAWIIVARGTRTYCDRPPLRAAQGAFRGVKRKTPPHEVTGWGKLVVNTKIPHRFRSARTSVLPIVMPARRFPPPWSVEQQALLFCGFSATLTRDLYYLLPERIDGISL